VAGKAAEVTIARRHEVLRIYTSPAGLGKHNAGKVAKRLGVSERTLWTDLKIVREQWSKRGNPVMPDAATVQARIESALSVAWEMVGEVDEDGEKVHDSDTILKALDRVYKGIDLQAKVAGAYAAEQVDVNIKAEAQPLPPALYELLEAIHHESQTGMLEGVSAGALWARFEKAMSGPDVLTIEAG
jgi:hypothetical protein